MEENQNKNKQQGGTANQQKGGQKGMSAQQRNKLIGIIVLLILGFAVNYFFGDNGKETGQDGYTAEATLTPGATLSAAPTQSVQVASSGKNEGNEDKDKTGNESTSSGKTEGDKDKDKTGNENINSGNTEENEDKDKTGNESISSGNTEGDEDKNDTGNENVSSGNTEGDEDKDKTENENTASGKNEENKNKDEDKAEAETGTPTGTGETTPEVTPAQTASDEPEILYEFRRTSYLEQHFEKHGAEFDYATKEEYLAGANRVILSPDALHKLESEDGDDIYYLEETNEFVVVSKDGYIRTYFRPSAGIAYYNRQ